MNLQAPTRGERVVRADECVVVELEAEQLHVADIPNRLGCADRSAKDGASGERDAACESTCRSNLHPRTEGARLAGRAGTMDRLLFNAVSIATKNTGVRNRPNNVTPSMPEKTAMPIARRSSLPAPVATASGTTPMMNANEVINMGRKRKRHASTAASITPIPCSTRSRANSTIRIAFLHASPTRTMNPICVSTLLSQPASRTPSRENSRHIGTINTIARGKAQLSYCAARIRKTSSTQRGKTSSPAFEADCCWKASSVHSYPKPFGNVLASTRSIASVACPEE